MTTQESRFDEVKNWDLETIVGDGVNFALSYIQREFENTAYLSDRLTYHNTLHTLTVIDRTVRILQAVHETDPILVTEKDILLGTVAAAFHDVVQGYEESADGALSMRQRYGGTNEELSAAMATAWMDRQGAFSQEDKKRVREAILATIVAFDPKVGITQPNLTETSSPIARALALADVGTPGMQGADGLTRDSITLFIENNMDFSLYLFGEKGLNSQQRQEIMKKYQSFAAFQNIFVGGRIQEQYSQIAGFGSQAAPDVEALFSHFDESIACANTLSEQSKTMSFDDLILLAVNAMRVPSAV